MRTERGFSLIEIVVVLVLLGMAGAMMALTISRTKLVGLTWHEPMTRALLARGCVERVRADLMVRKDDSAALDARRELVLRHLAETPGVCPSVPTITIREIDETDTADTANSAAIAAVNTASNAASAAAQARGLESRDADDLSDAQVCLPTSFEYWPQYVIHYTCGNAELDTTPVPPTTPTTPQGGRIVHIECEGFVSEFIAS